jgi:hypothetical protein
MFQVPQRQHSAVEQLFYNLAEPDVIPVTEGTASCAELDAAVAQQIAALLSTQLVNSCQHYLHCLSVDCTRSAEAV